jgi:hypothetical protein
VRLLPNFSSTALDSGAVSAGEEQRRPSQGHPRTIFRRALERGNLVVAEATAKELPPLSLTDEARSPCFTLRAWGRAGPGAPHLRVSVVTGPTLHGSCRNGATNRKSYIVESLLSRAVRPTRCRVTGHAAQGVARRRGRAPSRCRTVVAPLPGGMQRRDDRGSCDGGGLPGRACGRPAPGRGAGASSQVVARRVARGRKGAFSMCGASMSQPPPIS